MNALFNITFAAMIAAATAAQWTVDVTSRGGFVAREERRVIEWNGSLKIGGCRFHLSDSELEVIQKTLAKTQPARWEPAYGSETACCDLVTYDVVLTRHDGAGRRATYRTRWTLGAPDDLAALTRAVMLIERDAAQCR